MGRQIRGDDPEVPGQGGQVVAPGETGGPQAVEQQQRRPLAPVFKVPAARRGYLGHLRHQDWRSLEDINEILSGLDMFIYSRKRHPRRSPAGN
jgi:hypothetical protein